MSRGAPAPLWTPSPEHVERAALTAFARRHGLPEDYHALWRWSVADIDRFWATIWDTFAVESAGPRGPVLGSRALPGAEWFPEARISYAAHLFRDKPDDRVAIRHAAEGRAPAAWTWGDLREQTGRVAAGLRALGVREGDRVCALLPNVPETVAAFLACASIGAIWSSAAPEFGARTVVDRFGQIEPKVLLAVDGYRYNGRAFSCDDKVAEIAAALPDTRVVRLGHLAGAGWEPGFLGDAPLRFAVLPFGHPLWVLYSSGTTGPPKAIVHSQGGILLEHLRSWHLQIDATAGDRVFWFTTTGWMMWNYLVGALLTDASIVLYDGSPAGAALWDLAAETRITTFGTSAAFVATAMKEGIRPAEGRDLSALRAVGSTGSPLSPEGFTWIADRLGADTWPFSISGGTDVCTGFVGGAPTLPVYAGEIQARALGADVQAWSADGRPLIGEVGELVVTQPMPSMPIGFWNDPGGDRLRESYFETFPGVWRHGDWVEITERETVVISGRSDATINRGGIRMGTSEIYRAVLALDEVVDALVVDVPREGADSWMPLFVVLRPGRELDDELTARIRAAVRRDCSPRHVPDEVLRIPEVPRTLSGKALEVPVKRILMGTPADRATARDGLANPSSLDWFAALAQRRRG